MPMRNVPDLKFEPDWRRLKFVIEQSGLSMREFAELVELEDSDLIVHIRYAQCGIDEQLARKIHRVFPQYSMEWLQGQSDAAIPETANMFRQVKALEHAQGVFFELADKEFEARAKIASDLLIRMIPNGHQQQELLDELNEEISELTHLLEIMKLFVHPTAQSDLHRANDIYDDLCAAAEKMGLHE